ncbi:MAG: hypothetical protein H7A47_11495 [Verrucomicrobiales bacterium]|nr:hypothetical protein [Verrucomicrobiales bacterium]
MEDRDRQERGEEPLDEVDEDFDDEPLTEEEAAVEKAARGDFDDEDEDAGERPARRSSQGSREPGERRAVGRLRGR